MSRCRVSRKYPHPRIWKETVACDFLSLSRKLHVKHHVASMLRKTAETVAVHSFQRFSSTLEMAWFNPNSFIHSFIQCSLNMFSVCRIGPGVVGAQTQHQAQCHTNRRP